MDSYRQAVSILPEPLRTGALGVGQPYMVKTEEIRLRIGRVPSLVLPEGEMDITNAAAVTGKDLVHLVEIASRWSMHAVLEQLRRGYLSVEGGHRLGLCGTVIMDGEQVQNLRDISSADLRVARQLRGIARTVAGQLWQDGQLQNTLILAPPGAGKTTLLRDLIRCVSEGEVGPPQRVAVADERGELAAVWQGRPQMELGRCTDVLDGCPKAQAIPMLLRGMSPQVIAVDEITQREDIRAIEQAVGCGTALLATAHGSGTADLRRRPLYRDLVEKRIFHKLVTIRVEEGGRKMAVTSMEEIP